MSVAAGSCRTARSSRATWGNGGLRHPQGGCRRPTKRATPGSCSCRSRFSQALESRPVPSPGRVDGTGFTESGLVADAASFRTAFSGVIGHQGFNRMRASKHSQNVSYESTGNQSLHSDVTRRSRNGPSPMASSPGRGQGRPQEGGAAEAAWAAQGAATAGWARSEAGLRSDS